jgi:hypothetical protein
MVPYWTLVRGITLETYFCSSDLLEMELAALLREQIYDYVDIQVFSYEYVQQDSERLSCNGIERYGIVIVCYNK